MKGYRTLIFNAAAILAVIGAHYGFDLPPTVWEAAVLAVVNVALRMFTTTPIGQK